MNVNVTTQSSENGLVDEFLWIHMTIFERLDYCMLFNRRIRVRIQCLVMHTYLYYFALSLSGSPLLTQPCLQ